MELADGKAKEGCVGIGSNVAWQGGGCKERYGRVMNLVKGTGGGRVLYRYPVALGSDIADLKLRILTFKFKNEHDHASRQRQERVLIYNAELVEIDFQDVYCTGKLRHMTGSKWKLDEDFFQEAMSEGIKKRRKRSGGRPQDYENYLFWLLHTPPIVYGAYTRLILTLRTSFFTIIPLYNIWAPLGRFCERVATLVKY